MSETAVGRYDRLLDAWDITGAAAARAFDRSVEFPDENLDAAAEIARLRETHAGREIVWRTQLGHSENQRDRTIGYALSTEDPEIKKGYQRLSTRSAGPIMLTSTAGSIGEVVSRIRGNPARIAGAEYIDPFVTPGVSLADLRKQTLDRILPPTAGTLTPGAPVRLLPK